MFDPSVPIIKVTQLLMTLKRVVLDTSCFPLKISGYVSENQYNLRNNPEMHEIPVKVEHDELEEKIIENYLNLNLKIAIN